MLVPYKGTCGACGAVDVLIVEKLANTDLCDKCKEDFEENLLKLESEIADIGEQKK